MATGIAAPTRIRQHSAAASAVPPALEAHDLSLGYESGPALDRVSFQVAHGEQLAVIGPNGAGKSTLFKLVAGLLRPDSGSLGYFGTPAPEHNAIAYLPQRSQVDWHFPVSVADVVLMGRTGRIGLLRRPRRRDHDLARAALAEVKLDHLADRQISQLSGGQQQRVFIARALAQEARLLLMDEPLGGLDLRSQETIFAILAGLRSHGVTVLTALHDLKLAAQYFDRVMLLNRRLVALGGANDVLTPANLVAAYGGHLHLSVVADGLLTVADTCCCGEGVVV